ncbi:Gamma-aminobutyric acid (GABA) B receptor [Seminavis robusta]|uniref:Gamma-aminobutyric acid (GABA) B receptor n=1 Tax=Seminavis robusta TaxID=568900 RepID=A0A9N8DGR8_9STRA|nr:Gamma-aminobutyric acid (GABA) B receptor [Seminavis robusta]|eukprot:Sro144_g066870.1 Gamma-aminobutyric acid (GABA) B receptor (441) ;mRNA; f:12607-13929
MASAIFPLGMDDDYFGKVDDECPECDAACKTWPWLFFVGFTIIFSAIFSKLLRLNKFIAQSLKAGKATRQAKNIKVETKDVILPFAALLSLNVVLLTIWTVVDPLVWQRVPTGEFSSYGTCKPEHGTPAIVLGLFLGAVNLGALLLAEIEAYKARNISDHLSESKYIGLATVSMFQMFAIGIPVIFLVQDKPEAQFFVYSGIIFVICMAILSLIFLPKVHFDRHPPPKATIKGSKDFGLNLKLPKYGSSQVSSFEDDCDSNSSDDEDENTLELIRLRRAVEEYRFKFYSLKREVESKKYMEVEPFLASLENKTVVKQGVAPMEQPSSCSAEKPKFWTDSGFDLFTQYIPPEEQVVSQEEAPQPEEADSDNRKNNETEEGPPQRSAHYGGWGKSDFEVFSEFEQQQRDEEDATSEDPEKGKVSCVGVSEEGQADDEASIAS